MTAAELLAHCKTFEKEHGMIVLCDVLETIFESHEQASGFILADDEEIDEAAIVYVTVQ
jgi:hypothetical protein